MYNHVHDCNFTDYGYHNGNDNSVVFGLGIERSTTDGTKYNLVENSTFSYGGHHVVEVNGSQNIFRNNYVHNEPHFAFTGTECFSFSEHCLMLEETSLKATE
jgi:hypothetical protein